MRRIKSIFIYILVALILGVSLVYAIFHYLNFVSNTIYEESTAHLIEIFHQANQTLYNLVSVNWSRMRMWVPYIEIIDDFSDGDYDYVKVYLEQAREESNFTDFYFISRNGNYYSLNGNYGYLDLREKLSELIIDKEPIVINSVVPSKPEIMVFAIPVDKSIYHGFEYEAIAITFNNSDLVEALKISTFDGQASTFAILPDGRVVVDNGSNELKNTRNFYAYRDTYSNLTSQEIDSLRKAITSNEQGTLQYEANGKKYYLIYEGANFQDWIVLGIVPCDVVNSSMNRLQVVTISVVSGILLVLVLLGIIIIIQQNRQKLKMKDHELLVREELFSKLSVNVDDVFIMIASDGHRVDYVSPNIEKLTGITQESVKENINVIIKLLRGNTSTILNQLLTIAPGEQREFDREYTHQKTNEILKFRVVVFCTEIQGEKKYILDLSDRTKDMLINQQLEEAVKTAENASKAKTAFLNNMSHDIRTPMNAIIGFTNIAMKMNPKKEVQNCLEKISSSSDHLLTLINDVLDISRIESGKVKFMPEPNDIKQIEQTVIGITQGFLINRNIQFITKLGKPSANIVDIDAVRLREVLVNILGNAVKFTPDGGIITFETIYQDNLTNNEIICTYRVCDSGVGMSKEFTSHIFDEFTQEDNGARTQYKGSGLGMTITKRYVNLMGGDISVESEKGVGSTFTVIIPMKVSSGKCNPQVNNSIDINNFDGIKVLLAEDNDLNAEIAMIQLEELGFNVTRVTNGKEAFETFKTEPKAFDIILMDIMMPLLNGYEATKLIRTIDINIPIIAMTANAFAEDIQLCLDAGMNDHIAKPIDTKLLISTLQKYFQIYH